MNKEVLITVGNELGLTIFNEDHQAAMHTLAERINQLINEDFEKLLNILYRVDVSEARLKQLLKENKGNDAGMIIAELLVERQLQKMKSRKESRQNENDIDGNEKW